MGILVPAVALDVWRDPDAVERPTNTRSLTSRLRGLNEPQRRSHAHGCAAHDSAESPRCQPSFQRHTTPQNRRDASGHSSANDSAESSAVTGAPVHTIPRNHEVTAITITSPGFEAAAEGEALLDHDP